MGSGPVEDRLRLPASQLGAHFLGVREAKPVPTHQQQDQRHKVDIEILPKGQHQQLPGVIAEEEGLQAQAE